MTRHLRRCAAYLLKSVRLTNRCFLSLSALFDVRQCQSDFQEFNIVTWKAPGCARVHQPDGQKFIWWTGRSSRLSYGTLHYTCRRFLWTIILAAIDSSEPFSPSGAFKTTKEVPRPRKQDQDFPAPRPRLPTLPDRHTSQISCSSQSRWPVVPPSEDARYALALRY